MFSIHRHSKWFYIFIVMIHSHITMNCLISIYLYQYSILLFYFNCVVSIVVLYQGLRLTSFFWQMCLNTFSCICVHILVYSFDSKYLFKYFAHGAVSLLKLYTADVYSLRPLSFPITGTLMSSNLFSEPTF